MDVTPGVKFSARTVRTLVFGLVLPVWVYLTLAIVMRSGLSKSSGPGMLAGVGVALVSCVAAWLVVRPVRIRWVKWPWWSVLLLALGWAVRAWLLAGVHPWPWILNTMSFYLLAVGFQEEFIFRGCVEEGLSQLGPWAAPILAGLFFGLVHAPLALLQGAAPVYALLNPLLGGVLHHLVMRWLRDTGGLVIPMLVHGLMDFLGAA